jgi:hypothetical protein
MWMCEAASIWRKLLFLSRRQKTNKANTPVRLFSGLDLELNAEYSLHHVCRQLTKP